MKFIRYVFDMEGPLTAKDYWCIGIWIVVLIVCTWGIYSLFDDPNATNVIMNDSAPTH
jgi:uncharacterized membrane protein YhaH (DUF805 family)